MSFLFGKSHKNYDPNAHIQARKTMSNYGHCTIIDNNNFFPEQVAADIHNALNNGDKETIINHLTSISNPQRQKLREVYFEKYGQEIDKALDKKLSGDIEKVVLALLDTPLEYDLKQIRDAIKGFGTDENVLIEILCTRTPEQMVHIKSGYETLFNKDLAKEVAGDTSGDFKNLLLALINGSKDGSRYINEHQAKEVFEEFERHTGQPIEQAVAKEFKGDLGDSLLAIVRSTQNKQRFFAMQIQKAIKGSGTRDNDLIRVLISRSEVDLKHIQEEFHRLYDQHLIDAVKAEVKGPYQEALVNILRGNY